MGETKIFFNLILKTFVGGKKEEGEDGRREVQDKIIRFKLFFFGSKESYLYTIKEKKKTNS